MSPRFSTAKVEIEGREFGLGFQPNREDTARWMAWDGPLRVDHSSRRSRFWNMGWRMIDGAHAPLRLDQNGFPHCVGYGGAHQLANGPITQPNVTFNNELGDWIYVGARRHDPWEGEDYDGSSASGFAGFAKTQGWVESYWWGYDIETVINMILEKGPVGMGLTWTNSMFFPDDNGVIKVDYSSGIAGGHYVVGNGANRDAQYGLGETGYVRLENTWGALGSPFIRGAPWGLNGKGYCRISITDLAMLLEDQGEMLLMTELQV